jgi:hypothetical protein
MITQAGGRRQKPGFLMEIYTPLKNFGRSPVLDPIFSILKIIKK